MRIYCQRARILDQLNKVVQPTSGIHHFPQRSNAHFAPQTDKDNPDLFFRREVFAFLAINALTKLPTVYFDIPEFLLIKAQNLSDER